VGDFDTSFIIVIISVIVAVGGFVASQLWNIRNRKDSVETALRAKRKEEQDLARDLKEHNERVAEDVKKDMRDHVDQLIGSLKLNLELERSMIYHKIELLEVKVLQDKIDLAEHIKNQNNVNEREQKALEFLQTMAWGPDAKSVPPYMRGEIQTQQHKDEPDIGAFAGEGEGEGEGDNNKEKTD